MCRSGHGGGGAWPHRGKQRPPGRNECLWFCSHGQKQIQTKLNRCSKRQWRKLSQWVPNSAIWLEFYLIFHFETFCFKNCPCRERCSKQFLFLFRHPPILLASLSSFPLSSILLLRFSLTVLLFPLLNFSFLSFFIFLSPVLHVWSSSFFIVLMSHPLPPSRLPPHVSCLSWGGGVIKWNLAKTFWFAKLLSLSPNNPI